MCHITTESDVLLFIILSVKEKHWACENAKCDFFKLLYNFIDFNKISQQI